MALLPLPDALLGEDNCSWSCEAEDFAAMRLYGPACEHF